MERIKGLFRITEFVLLLIIIGLFILGWAINPRFVNTDNLQILFRDTALLAIAAIGVGFTILTGGIDLSVGSIVGLAGVMSAYFMMNWKSADLAQHHPDPAVSACLIGMYHGLFVTKLKMHGFLITLVTMGLARGAILVLTNAFPITGLPRGFTNIGQEYVLGIPIPVLIAIVVAVVAYYLLRVHLHRPPDLCGRRKRRRGALLRRERRQAHHPVLHRLGGLRFRRRHDPGRSPEPRPSRLRRRLRAAGHHRRVSSAASASWAARAGSSASWSARC